MTTRKNNTDRDQVLDIFMNLTDDNRMRVLEFAKMRVFTQLMDLPAEMIPSIDEWEKTPLVVRQLCVMAIDQAAVTNSTSIELVRRVSN